MLDGSGSVVTTPSNAVTLIAFPGDEASLGAAAAPRRRSTATRELTPLPPRHEPVGGGEQGVLAGIGGQLGDDPATVEHCSAVAHEADLAQLAGEHEDGRAFVGERADEVVHLMLGADVDAARRVEQQHHAQPTGEPAGDRHLLLVAARQAPDLARGSGVDRQAADRFVNPLALLGRGGSVPTWRCG